MPYVRFPIPEFRYEQYKDLDWDSPQLIDAAEAEEIATGRRTGKTTDYGCYAVSPGSEFFERFGVRGEHRHALLCLLPDAGARMIGRSRAWFINRALVTSSLDPASLKVIADWKTTRPINTRLGPEDGIEVSGALYVVCCRRYGDHWIGNRTLIDSTWDGEAGTAGFRILSSSEEEINEFHHANLTFHWPA